MRDWVSRGARGTVRKFFGKTAIQILRIIASTENSNASAGIYGIGEFLVMIFFRIFPKTKAAIMPS
jgi:hypothetical protein